MGYFYSIEDAPALDKKLKHDIDVVVDRIVTKAGQEQRLADSLADGAGAGGWCGGRGMGEQTREGR